MISPPQIGGTAPSLPSGKGSRPFCRPFAGAGLESQQVKSHCQIDERSLAFGHAIAARLAEHPALIDRARATLTRWLTTCSPRTRPALQEWLTALDGPPEAVRAILTSTDERATRLRQSSPFTGVLTEQERTEILKRFEKHDAAPT